MVESANSHVRHDVKSSLQAILADHQPDPNDELPLAVQRAIFLTRALQTRAAELQTPQERRQQAELDRMMHHAGDKVTLMQMTDQAFRSNRPNRAADQLVHILDVQGIPRFFTPMDRMLLKGFQSFGSYLPGVAIPFVKDKMQHETANVILPAEKEVLVGHLRNRRQEGTRMNVNFLGEALLGEEEAQNRLRRYLQSLQWPEIEVISVKISTIFSQIRPIARQHTLTVLCDRLELLFRAAAKSTYELPDGTVVPKFVYLDMEEYRDMSLTADAFMHTLDRPGLENVSGGIALQAYVPDSYGTQCRLTEWARRRVDNGGAPMTIRIVKGANMETERVDASLHGWPLAPYKTKLQTDANFKKMLHFGMQPENLSAVRLGIASHNLFDLAYGLVLALDQNVLDSVQFEMLEGMANHQRRALFEQTRNVLLYAPACTQEDFIHAIGYLIRRLDENTGPDNFLRYAFKLDFGGPDWQRLDQQFRDSFRAMDNLDTDPRRTQDRRQPPTPIMSADRSWQQLVNEPDTDFALPQNATWAEAILDSWRDRCGDNAASVPLVVNGEQIRADRPVRESFDPSRPGVVVARYCQGTDQDVSAAVDCANRDDDGWRGMTFDQRSAILAKVAQEIRLSRAELMGAALAEGGKILTESDPEVSEAVDFVEFYARAASYFANLSGLEANGRGTVVVVSPWNFPIAIPCGGIAAALAAGNTVILKPASDTVLVAYLLCECFWRAGVSPRALQFLPCPGATVGQLLVGDENVDTVILTGGTETALTMLAARPRMRLFAETGGKNATIVTAMSDRDQAIKHVIHSAFSHSGQKCSATSLLILEDELFRDAKLKFALCDAVTSLHVGSAWDLPTQIGPLIRAPQDELETSLKELEPEESWAVLPVRDEHNPQLYSPAVKWNVQPGSFTHTTEFFGPVLGVMRARDLFDAIELTNATGYGLTSGLESLDDREQSIWQEGIRAGNLYVNRGTTGAIVLRQPFGGMGKSAFGPGIKAGGPNYVAQLMRFRETEPPPGVDEISDQQLVGLFASLHQRSKDLDPKFPAGDVDRALVAARSYEQEMRDEFSQDHDHFLLIGQDNIRRYLPVRELRIRVHEDDTCFEILARVCAAKAVGSRITLSFPSDYADEFIQRMDQMTHDWAAAIELVEESDDQLATVMREGHTLRVRYADPSRVPTTICQAAAETGIYVADAPVFAHGRIELLWYVEEQSICDDYHRYGNLGKRSDETRAEVL